MKWKTILMIAFLVALYGRQSETDNHPTFLGYRLLPEIALPPHGSEFCHRNLDVCSAIDFVVVNLHRLSLEVAELTTLPEHSEATD